MGQSQLISVLKSLVYVDRQRRKRLLRREAWAAIVLAYVALLAAWLAPGSFQTTSTAAVLWTWVMMLVRMLYFQIGLLMLLIGIVAAARHQWRMASACGPLVLLTIIPAYLNFSPTRSAAADGARLKIISANLLMVNQTTGPILDEIAESGADVVFLQEYTDHWDRAFQSRFHAQYPYRAIYPQEDSFGAAIYSRTPFLRKPRLDSSMGKWAVVQLSADVEIEGREVECRNIHLVPPRTLEYTVEHLDEMRDFVRNLKEDKDKTVIIAGDFNFTGSTLQAREIENAGFHDAFVEAGRGRGSTWPVNGFFRYLPGIRFDHIFLSRRLSCRWIDAGKGRGSDHRPLRAEISLLPTF